MRVGNQETYLAYLQPAQLAALRRLSRKTRTPVAQLIRDGINLLLLRSKHDRQTEVPAPQSQAAEQT